jgi:hypothetical protein
MTIVCVSEAASPPEHSATTAAQGWVARSGAEAVAEVVTGT